MAPSFNRIYFCGAIAIALLLLLSTLILCLPAAARDVYRWRGGRLPHRG
jgi:hypothetical protein